jgi:hypothetical protein
VSGYTLESLKGHIWVFKVGGSQSCRRPANYFGQYSQIKTSIQTELPIL